MINYKTNKIGITITLTAVFLTLMGFLLHARSGYLEEGVYFRQTYGYIGVSESEDIVLDFTLYSLGTENLTYFDEPTFFDVDNDLVFLKDIEVRSIQRAKDIDVIELRVTLYMSDYGVTTIERLRQKNINNKPIKSYEIGSIVIENIQAKPLMVSHQVNQRFFDQAEYNMNLDSHLSESYLIKDVIINHEKILFNKEFLPLLVVPGKKTELSFELDFKDINYDVIVVKPLIFLSKEGDETSYLLKIYTQTRYDMPLSYQEIISYIEYSI
ncbi:MAG: hypothetical protein WCZ13_03455 [Acholeplasmataceae bacterium]